MTLGPPNLASTVNRFSFPRQAYNYDVTNTVTDAGEMINSADPTPLTIRIHMHPSKPSVVKRLAEGHEVADFQTGQTTDSRVRIADPDAKLRGTVVIHNGKQYEAIEEQDWMAGSSGVHSYRTINFVRVHDRRIPP